MGVTLKPYPEYKDSGLSWLGKTPKHWELSPGFSAFRPRQHKNTGMVETTVLSLSYGKIVVKPPEKLHGLVPASFETHQVVHPGEIIIRPTDLQNDWNSLRVGIARNRGIISPAYLCLRTIGRLVPDYGYLLLHTYDLMKIFYGMGSGLRQNLDYTDLKRLPVPVPPREEQDNIVQFVANAERRINHLIRAKRRLIELLNEQKQAIIHRAVTRGLDPNVRLKPSGIESLGDVPEHWRAVRVRRLVSTIDQGVSPQAEGGLADDGSWGVLKAGCVNRGEFRETEHKRLPEGFSVDTRIVVREGDVLVSRACGSPKLVGSVGRVGSLRYRLILSDKTFRLNFPDQVTTPFLVAAMNSHYFRVQIERAISGAQGLANNLPLSALKDFSLALPPSNEAAVIADRLNGETQQLVAAIARAHREVDLLQEYRRRLVADVVTGKLDVRGVELPATDEAKGLEDLETGEGTEAAEMADSEGIADGDAE